MAKIFQTMQGNYGTRFLNQWKTGQILQDGTDAGIKNAMAYWAEKLGGFADQPECIKSVLDALPIEPPSLPQFVELCREAARRVDRSLLALPHHPTPEDIEENKRRLAQMAEMLAKAKRMPA